MKLSIIIFVLGFITYCFTQTCPSGTCSDQETCCQTDNGGWGCCQYPQATCCSDHKHCCPSGYTCDLQHKRCVQQDRSVPMLITKFKVLDVTCQDGSSCKDGSTCCQLASGGYGCCPYPQATCCSDKKSCCPNGYTCDLQHGQCVSKARSTMSITKLN